MESTIVAAQPSLSRQASLNSFFLRRPSPSSFFGQQTVSHFTTLLLVLSGEANHRKFLINLSIQRQVLLGMGIAIEMWRGIEERTCFTIISLLAKKRHLSFQPANLDRMESKILLKRPCSGLLKNSRTPR